MEGDGAATAVRPARQERPAPRDLTFRSEVPAITRLEDAQKNVFIPYFRQCSAPRDGKPGLGPDGQVCANVSIAGATEPGRYYADYASCDIVLTHRPYWPVPAAGKTAPDDPRLKDEAYMREVAWTAEQVRSSACVCCHDSKLRPPGMWDVSAEGIWTDSMTSRALAFASGLADSTVLGRYPAEENFGFDRLHTGIPTTDPERMRAFFVAELARRGVTEEQARQTPPFGGPVFANQMAKPTACAAGEGVDDSGRVLWTGGSARYVYVLDVSSPNPGVPPNLDLPEGTIWRLDVPANESAIASGVPYATTPAGTVQSYPPDAPAAALERGKAYHLIVWQDVGISIANCLFTFGEVVAEKPPATPDPETAPPAGEGCTLAGGDAAGFGAACKSDADCTCSAGYCALQPGASDGYCTTNGCKVGDASACPSGWACFDLSRFVPGQPAFCRKSL